MDKRSEYDIRANRNGPHVLTNRRTEVVANNNRDRAFVVWAMIAVVAMVCVNIAVELYSMLSRKPDPLAEAALEPAIMRSLDRAVQRAEQMSNEVKHLEAGLLLADIAGAQRVLSAAVPPGSADTIGFAESAALMEFSRTENEQVWSAYIAFLKVRYPDWLPPETGLLQPFPRASKNAGSQ